MGEDDALARSRRAAGVEEAGGFILVHRGVVERRPRRGGDESVVLAVVDADHAIDEVGERARVAIGDEDPRAGIQERIRQLRLGPAEVEWDLGSSTGRDAAVELHELDRVERQHTDSITRPRAELDDHRVEAFESLEELDVGDAGVAADQRLAIARDTYRSTHGVDERVHGPSIAH